MIIDTHCHLYDEKFENAQEIINNLEKNNVEKVIVCGCSQDSCKKAFSMAENNKNVFCTLGIHPENANELTDDMIDFIRKNANNSKVVAIGEIGLDYYNEFFTREQQKEIFVRQIELASELSLPIVVHIRDAYGDALKILKDNLPKLNNGVVLHCFSGSVEYYKEIEKLGFYVSLGGVLTYKNNINGVNVAKVLNKQMFMFETDAPYLSPVPLRGTINEPKNIFYVARKMSDIWEIDENKIIDMATKNSYNFFKKLK